MSKGQHGKRGGGHSDLCVCVCVCVCVCFSSAYLVFQFTIAASLPLFWSISYPAGLWNVRNFHNIHMGTIAGVGICHCISLYVWLHENQAVLHWPLSA